VIDTAKYGPWALIAGGSEGVGAEFARLLAKAGVHLVLVARTAGALQQTADACRLHGAEIRTVQADLSDPGACSDIAAATRDLEIGLLILVAGANTHTDVGVPHFAPSLPNGWTGTDTRASVGQPNNLGNPIGLPN